MEASEGEAEEEEGAAALMSEDEGVLLPGPGEAEAALAAGAAGGEAAVKGSPEYQAGKLLHLLLLRALAAIKRFSFTCMPVCVVSLSGHPTQPARSLSQMPPFNCLVPSASLLSLLPCSGGAHQLHSADDGAGADWRGGTRAGPVARPHAAQPAAPAGKPAAPAASRLPASSICLPGLLLLSPSAHWPAPCSTALYCSVLQGVIPLSFSLLLWGPARCSTHAFSYRHVLPCIALYCRR
jgi:hypothetical protein